jgi:carboxyl-terminal processing protease
LGGVHHCWRRLKFPGAGWRRQTVIELNEKQRISILNRVSGTVAKRFYDPMLNGIEWEKLVAAKRDSIARAKSTDEFEREINELLKALGTSHVGFFHQSLPRGSSRQAIAATFCKAETKYGTRWVFQDVHAEGPAHLVGIQPGDVLLRVGNREVVPPESPWFTMGSANSVTVAKPDGRSATFTVAVPLPKSMKPPVVIPRTVVSSRLEQGIGLIKIAMFPGIVGIDVAKEITQAASALECDRLIIDLRGNTGGGMGCLRLMGLLCPDKKPVGYSLSRRGTERAYRPEDLPQFGRIPSEKWELIPLLFRFAFRDRSVALVTEGLGRQKFHGKIAILVNEHSASASEMVAAFASENALATIVGTKTAGRLMAANAFKVGFGYRVALPIAAYKTWQGKMLEGVGVSPHIEVDFNPERDLQKRDDPQLDAAITTVSLASISTVRGQHCGNRG